WLADYWRSNGFGVLAVEYPGYDGDGTPTEERIFAAAERAVATLESRVGHDRVILMGQSLGTGVAVHLAALGHGTRLILLSPPTTTISGTARQSPCGSLLSLCGSTAEAWEKM